MEKSEKTKKNSSTSNRVLTIVGIVLCVILVPLLIINITLIIQSYAKPDKVPAFAGITPMVVMTDSMDPTIKGGDLIICRKIKAEDVKKDDIISFFDPKGNGTSVVTHRVYDEPTTKDGELAWQTKGDANNSEDPDLVPAKNLVGLYVFRIPGAGRVALFMRTTQGLIICVVLPIILLVGYDILRRRKYEKERKKDTDALMQELEELRAKADEQK